MQLTEKGERTIYGIFFQQDQVDSLHLTQWYIHGQPTPHPFFSERE